MQNTADDVYALKRIRFHGSAVQIVLQNANGPCPLLAITNVLLLRGALSLHEDRTHVTYRHLVELLGEYLFSHERVESEQQAKVLAAKRRREERRLAKAQPQPQPQPQPQGEEELFDL